MLVEAYGDAALSESREWFQKFKNGEFDIEDKERSGRSKVYKDAELEVLLDEDSCQMQKELALTLGVIQQQTISYRLKSLGMIEKQGNWIPYELKPRNVERRFFICEMLVRHKRKSFLHRIVTDEKWTTIIDKRRENHGDYLAMLQRRQPNRIFMKKNSCVFGGISLVSCIMSCSTERDHYWGSLPNTIDEIELSTQGKTHPLLQA